MTDIHQTAPSSAAPAPPSGRGRRPGGGGWLDRFLQGTPHHYLGVLPGAFGRLRDTLLRLFYSGVRLEESQAAVLRELPPQAIVVFASRFRCAFPFLFAHTRYRALGLPFPRV
nr:hypothetical protein [Desulfobacterales bacterium]